MTVTLDDYAGGTTAWCPGCGNFGILNALKKALVELGLEPFRVLMVSGIGQAGKLPHYTRSNVLNVLHGRTLPAAVAAKIANPELVIIALGGDGDGYAEGGNHFIHTMRRNHDVTYLVHNNQIYGLTKGQASPTTDMGYVTKTTPDGAWLPENPIAVAIAAGATFVARGFAGDPEHLAGLIKMAIQHRGFAFVDILQPCVSFNRLNTYAWYRQRVYKLRDDLYDRADKLKAFETAQEWEQRIPIGVFYKKESPTFEEQLPALKNGPLLKQKIEPKEVEKLLDEFM